MHRSSKCNIEFQDPTEKHFGDAGILTKYKDNNNKKNENGNIG